MEEIEQYGLYIIKDQYFADFPNDKYMQNKGENRPHYYAIMDSDGIYWMIPVSSKVEKFRAKILDVESKAGAGKCFLYTILRTPERIPAPGEDTPVGAFAAALRSMQWFLPVLSRLFFPYFLFPP